MIISGSQAFGMWLCHEGWALIDGIRAIIKENPERFISLPPCENTMKSLQPERGPSLNHAGILIVEFQPSRNTFLIYKLPSLRYFVTVNRKIWDNLLPCKDTFSGLLPILAFITLLLYPQ